MQDKAEAKSCLGAVEFFNTCPLVDGLRDDDRVQVHYAVPSRLADMLKASRVDAALVPVIDLARAGDAWERISDAGIASDGETLTVRVFSHVRPDQIQTLYLDADSHTSVVLAQLIWRHYFKHPVRVADLSEAKSPLDCESVLLIGDKVVAHLADPFAQVIDLGDTWKRWTGLPFVFAAWAAPVGRPMNRQLGELLSQARDRGVARAGELAAEFGPARGWPINLATRYLTKYLTYTITPAAREGMDKFISLARAAGFVASADKVVS